jgi:phosphoenolpyruvate carboxykinase (ATP)
MVYARWLAKRVEEHGADVWLLNTGWTGGPYGTGSRFSLPWTRAFVTAILDGSLRDAKWTPDDVFGLRTPNACNGVPDSVLVPRQTWADPSHWDVAAKALAARFRSNDAKYALDDEVRAAGPNV